MGLNSATGEKINNNTSKKNYILGECVSHFVRWSWPLLIFLICVDVMYIKRVGILGIELATGKKSVTENSILINYYSSTFADVLALEVRKPDLELFIKLSLLILCWFRVSYRWSTNIIVWQIVTIIYCLTCCVTAYSRLRENYLLWPWMKFVPWNSGNQTWSFVMNWAFSSSGGLESATGGQKKSKKKKH